MFTMVFGLLKRFHVGLGHASGNDDCHFTGLLRGLNAIMHVKCFVLSLDSNKSTKSVSNLMLFLNSIVTFKLFISGGFCSYLGLGIYTQALVSRSK